MDYRRPGKREYYLGIAQEVSRRGTCIRRNFGAVIVNNDNIISTGYTGAPRGTKNCIDIGHCYRQEQGVPKGQRYELCRSVHAEMNAIIHASRLETIGASMYLVGFSVKDGKFVENAEPCKLCKRMIINAGIIDVFVQRGNGNIARLIIADWVANEEEVFFGSSEY